MQVTSREKLSFKEIVSYSKEYGFIFPSSEIYEGLQSVYDYGPLGSILKDKLKSYWMGSMSKLNENIVQIDSSIMMHPSVWQASGHVDGFHDLMVDNKDSKKRYRVDVLIESHAEYLKSNNKTEESEKLISEMLSLLKSEDHSGLRELLIRYNIRCEVSDTTNWTDVRKFSLMFDTKTGAVEGQSNKIYLRPETAQGIFVNFLNVQKSQRMKIPFGICQIGKAFRNEIIARQFIFRMREFEQMEMQFFIEPGTEKYWFEYWLSQRKKWHKVLSIPELNMRVHPHDQLAHYASDAVDIEYNFPFGYKEVEGIHSRTDFDLKNHEDLSKKKMKYYDQVNNTNYIPYVIETSIGLDRLFLMVLSNCLTKDTIKSGEESRERLVLKTPYEISPNNAAILPLMKKDGLAEKAKAIFYKYKTNLDLGIDINQSIGKRYARQDIIGTPYCITIDHQTMDDDTVTLRDRDSATQVRVSISEAFDRIEQKTNMRNLFDELIN